MKYRLRAAIRGLKQSLWPLTRKVLALVLIETFAITTMPVSSSGASFPGRVEWVGILNSHQLAALFAPNPLPPAPAVKNAEPNATPNPPATPVRPRVAPAKARPPIRALVQPQNNLQAQTNPGIAVSVAFADSSSSSSNFPVPWQGPTNIVFLGGGTIFQAGALRLDNVSGSDLTIDSVTVDLGRPGPKFQLWSNFTIPANGSAILTQTANNNFNTSAASPIVGCGQPLAAAETRIPSVTVTIAGVKSVFSDSAHVLDTGGFDSSCQGNQSLAWRPIGTTGPSSPSATLSLFSENAPHDAGTPTTFTATLTDAANQPLANASVTLKVLNGPNAGNSVAGQTDSNGDANIQYSSSAQGVDLAQAVITNASGGVLNSNRVSTTWTSAQACVTSAPSPTATNLVYVGQTSGSFGDQLRVAALLTDGNGQPLQGRSLALTVGSKSLSATTDSNGMGAVTVTPGIGQTPVSISFGGDNNFPAAQTSSTLTIRPKATLLRYTGSTLLASAGAQPVSALLTDFLGVTPIANRTVTFTVGSTQATAITDANGNAATTITFPANQAVGPAQLAISFAGDADYNASSRVVPIEIYLTTSFVIWGGNTGGLKVGMDVNFWGAQWANQVTSGNFNANSSFKGFANPVSPIQQCQPNATTSTLAQGCWQANSGNSGLPPASLPGYIEVIVSTAITQQNTVNFGNIACGVVLKVDASPVYGPDPGQPGFGVITAVNGNCAGVFPAPAVLTASQSQVTPVLPQQQVTVNAGITNSGATAAVNATLNEAFDGLVPATGSQSFNTIAPGQTVTAAFPTTVPAIPALQGGETSTAYETRLAGVDGRFFTASGELAFTDPFQQIYRPLDFSSFSTLQIPRLNVGISGPACIVPGSLAVYPLTISNIGAGTATQGAATVTLPDATTSTINVPRILPSASFAGSVQWKAPVIKAKDPSESTATYLARLTASDNTTVSPTTASITWQDALSNTYGPVSQQFTSVKERLPILSLTPTAPATILPNQAATVNLAVTNSGGGNALQANIALQRQGTPDIVVPAFSLPGGQSATPTGTLRLLAIPTEGAQETDAQYLSRLQALDNQTLSLNANLSWTDASANLYGPTANPFGTTEVLPILTVAATGPTTAKPGDSISYTITAQNNGHANAAAINISFTLPDGSVQHPFAGTGLVAGGTAQTTVNFTVPGTQAAGPAIAALRMGWTDAAGNIYGFESATVATTILAQKVAITDFNPKQGPTGSAVSILGTNLSVPGGPTTVFFAGPNNTQLPATINFSSAAQLAVVVPNGAVTGNIQVTNSTGTATSAVPFTVGARQDFTVTASPATATVPQGSATSFVIGLTSPQTSFTQLASLSVIGMPQGVATSFNPGQITAGASSTLAVDLSATNLQPGTYSFTVQATATIDGKQQNRTATAALNVIAAGQTTLAGQVLSTSVQPIVGATVSLDGQSVMTDTAGRFLLVGVQAGTARPLSVDGHSAFSPNATFPLIFEPADVIAGRANVIPTPFILPPIDTSQEVTINPNQDTVAGNAAVPGLQMTIPKGANLRMLDGTLVTRTSITPLAPDRTPAPLPSDVGTNIVYTSQPGGAITDIPIPIVYPNVAGLNPGTEVELYAFDHAHVSWFVYGKGKVSNDGRTIAPEINPATGKPYGLPDFSWHFPNTGPNGNPSDPNGCPKSQGANPVDYASGMKIERVPQVSWGGTRGAFTFSLIYTTDKAATCLDGQSCPFGDGWTSNWDIRMTGTFAPGGAGRVVFPDQLTGRLFSSAGTDSSGTPRFTTTATTSQLGASVGAGVILGGSPVNQYRDPDGTLLNFNSAGRLISKVDANGNTTTLTYSNGNLTRITDPVGRSITLTYDGGFVSSMTDPLGRTWHYIHGSTFGQLLSITDPAGNITKYGYTGARLSSVIDPRGNTVKQITYDSSGRVATQTFADGGTETYSYSLSGTIVTSTTITDPLGRTKTMRFNGSGYVIGVTDAEGQSATIQRDLTTNVATTIVGPCGCNQAARSFSAGGDVTGSTNAVGAVWGRQYDPVFHVVTSATDPLGHVTTYTYDQNGHLLSKKDALGQTTSYTYDQFGELTSITDPSGAISQLQYDQQGNLSASIDPAGNTTTFEHDGLGHITATVDPLGRRSSMQYDIRDRLIATTDPAGNTTQYVYDADGNRTAIVNPLGKRWTYNYDAKNRLISRIDPLGNKRSYAYDVANQLISAKSPLGRVTLFTYTARGQKASLTKPNGEVIQYSYNATGNLTAITDAKGNSISYAYDSAGRVISRTDPLGHTSTVTYDLIGNVIQSTDKLGRQTSFVYDVLNRPTQVNYADATVSYVYDTLGRIIQKTDSAGGAIRWTFDTAGRVNSEISDKATVEYSYNAAGQILSTGIQGKSPVQYDYDQFGRLGSISYAGRSFSFQYDQASRRTALVRSNGVATTYSYDDSNRLVQISHANANGVLENLTYAFDADGRLTSTQALNNHLLLPVSATVGPADANNRVPQFGAESLSYDDQGDLIAVNGAQNSTNYNFDARGRLVSASLPTGTSIQYAYDALGRLASRTADNKTTDYIYAGSEVLQRSDNSGNELDFVNGSAGSERLLQSGTTGDLFFLQDRLSSIFSLTDATGNTVEQEAYEPFGNSQGSTLTEYGFIGERRDPDTNLLNFNARFYDPVLQRFITEDPLGITGGLNLFAYSENDPINRSDSSGLYWCGYDLLACASNIAAGAGDKLSFGFTNWVRDQLGINDVVDKCGLGYQVGGYVGDTINYSIQALSVAGPLIDAGAAAAEALEAAEAIETEAGLAADAETVADEVASEAEQLDAATAGENGNLEQSTYEQAAEGADQVTYTQEGDQFIRYESGNPDYTRVTPDGGLTPDTYCGLACEAPQTQGTLPETYNLPSPEIPRTVAYPVNPPPGTPVIIRPVAGGTGMEALFPNGVPAGSVGPPFPVPLGLLGP